MGEFIHVRLLISSCGKVAEAATVTCFIVSKWPEDSPLKLKIITFV